MSEAETRGARISIAVECPFCDSVMNWSRDTGTYTCLNRVCSEFKKPWHADPLTITLSRDPE